MSNPTNIAHTVDFFQGAFTIILALALSEALKAFTSDNQDQPLYWDRVPALLTFLCFFFPFFQSMSQYFYLAYLDPQTALKYDTGNLTFDGIIYMLQSGCFFTMSRSLAPQRWQRFYATVLVLMALDIVWIGITHFRGFHVIGWLYMDIFISVSILALMLFERGRPTSMRPSLIGLAIVVITTVPAYVIEHDMYFP